MFRILILSLISYVSIQANNNYKTDSLEAEFLSSKADTLIWAEEFEKAIYYFEQAAQKFEQTNQIARYLQQYSGISYCLSMSGKDIDYLRYIPNLEKYLSYTGPEIIWSYYLRLSGIYSKLGNYSQSLNLSKKSLSFIDPLDDNRLDKMAIFQVIANTYYQIGDYNLSKEYYLKKLNLAKKTDLYEKASTYKAIANILYKQKNYQAAIYNYNKSLPFIEKENRKIESQLANELKKIIYLKLAITYKEIKEYDEALKYNNLLLESGKSRYYERGLINLAQIYQCLRKTEKANIQFKETQQYILENSLSKPRIVAEFHEAYGDFHAETNQLDSALIQYQQGINTLMPEYDNQDYYNNPKDLNNILSEQDLLNLYSKKAKALTGLHTKTNNPKALKSSLKTYQLASQLITLIRQGIQTEASKQFLAERVIKIYEGAIETALKLEEITGEQEYRKIAFDFAEQNKAMVLLEALKDQEAKSLYLSDSLLDQETDYKTQIAFYEKNIYKEQNKSKGDSTKINDWENTVFDLKRKYERFQEKLEQDYPGYFNLKYKFELITLENIQAQLPNTRAMIEYFVGDSTLYSFVITKNNLEIIQSPRPDNFRAQIEDYRKSVGDFKFYLDSTKVAQQMYEQSGKQLFNWLLKDQIATLNPSIKELIIIPDDALSLVNFEALKGENQEYVIHNFAVSYAYSATHLFNFSQDKNKLSKDVAYGGFAPIYETDEPETVVEESSLAMRNFKTRGAFFDLPEARTAVQNIAQKLNGEFWLAEKATEQIFKENAHKYDILHLAMHGVTDNQNPLYSKLIFTQEKETGEDNYLNAYELYNMKLNAKLAVLSACNTGYGELKRGEGVMSMARAFAYSGCPSLVMSLWSVPSDETATIMTNFHEELKTGMAKNNALRKAKQRYLEQAPSERKHPFFWAGFISIGDVAPVYQSPFNLWKIGLSLLALFSIIILTFLFFKSKK